MFSIGSGEMMSGRVDAALACRPARGGVLGGCVEGARGLGRLIFWCCGDRVFGPVNEGVKEDEDEVE